MRRKAGGVRPIIDSAVSVLPLPVSPTTAVIASAAMEKLTSFSTQRRPPSGAGNVPL